MNLYIYKMEVKNITVVEALQYKNNKVICLIKLCPRYVKYFHGQLKPHKTYHWMEAEHWASFDSGLEKILDDHIAEFTVKDNSEETPDKRFQLNSLISVSVCVSSIPIKTLCLCAYGNNLSANDVALGLECRIEYSNEKNINDEPKSQSFKVENLTDNHEYEPQVISFQSEKGGCLIESAINPPLYTPSPKKKADSSEIIGLNIDEERYSPKPIDDTVDYVTSHLQVPTYSPSRITRKAKTNQIKTLDAGNEPMSCHPCGSERKQITQKKLSKRRRGKSSNTQKEIGNCESNARLYDGAVEKDICSSGEKSIKNSENDIHIDDLSSSLSDIPSAGEKCKRNPKNYNENILTLGPRRSSRSPIKPKRFLDMKSVQKKSRSKSQNAKTTIKSENLFGSDDEDFIRKTPETPLVKKSHPTNAKSSVKKRKREQTPNCDQEKQCMTTWLGKKKDEEKLVMKSNAKKQKSSRVDSPIPTRDDPLINISIAQLDEQIRKEKLQTEYNRKLKKVLEEMGQPDPKAVEILSLHDMSKHEILGTFTQHKAVLDEVFEKTHKKANVYGNDGIDHYTVMSLIDHNKQLDMMTKLSEIYENHDEGPSAYAKLYANAILPEWIIGIFMDKYNFTRDEAIQQVKAQESYKLHLAAKSDDTIEFE